MLIIVEGCDGVGKTTFVERLVGVLGNCRVLHRGPPEKTVWEEYTDDLVGYRPGAAPPQSHVICDRWHWGELVYGPLYRGQSELGWDGMRRVDRFLRVRGAVVCWLEHDQETIERRAFDERGETYLQREHVSWVIHTYDEIADNSTLPVLRFCDPGMADAMCTINVARAFENNAARRLT